MIMRGNCASNLIYCIRAFGTKIGYIRFLYFTPSKQQHSTPSHCGCHHREELISAFSIVATYFPNIRVFVHPSCLTTDIAVEADKTFSRNNPSETSLPKE